MYRVIFAILNRQVSIIVNTDLSVPVLSILTSDMGGFHFWQFYYWTDVFVGSVKITPGQ